MSSVPSTPAVKRLFAVSGNRCAFPNCPLPLVDQASGEVLGEICHIQARSPNGLRYNGDQSDADRHGFDNLILTFPPSQGRRCRPGYLHRPAAPAAQG